MLLGMNLRIVLDLEMSSDVTPERYRRCGTVFM